MLTRDLVGVHVVEIRVESMDNLPSRIEGPDIVSDLEYYISE